MQVDIDRVAQHAVLRGEAFEVRLTWSQAANLATILNEASREIEPVLNFGKTYCPATER